MAQDAATIKLKNISKVSAESGQVVKQLIRTPQVVKSDVVLFSDTTAINLFELPGNALILSADVHVTTAFDASGTSALSLADITAPIGGGTETLWSSTTLVSTGFYPSTTMAITPSSGGMLILNYTANTTTAGQLEVYLTYVQYEDKL